MKKHVLAMVVTAFMASTVASGAMAASSSTSVSGGTVNFVGQVVDAACSVASESADQTVMLDQVRTAKLNTPGQPAGQQTPFKITLEDCDTTVSQNAAVMFNGQVDADMATALANTAGAGGAENVALQLYGPDGNVLNMGEDSAAITLINGENVIPLSVDYVATSAAATAGNVSATATFNIVYS
jgi:type 1 fimbria pilin